MRTAFLGVTALSLTACSTLSIPIGSLTGREGAVSTSSPLETGSIGPSSTRPGNLQDGDFASMNAALNAALKADANAALIAWSNEKSGHNGLLTPFAPHETQAGQPVCRAVFVEATTRNERLIQTHDACRDTNGDWVLKTEPNKPA